MALEVERVVNGGVHAEKMLGGASRLEALHLALSSSHRLMRVFGSVVFAQPLLMQTIQSSARPHECSPTWRHGSAEGYERTSQTAWFSLSNF